MKKLKTKKNPRNKEAVIAVLLQALKEVPLNVDSVIVIGIREDDDKVYMGHNCASQEAAGQELVRVGLWYLMNSEEGNKKVKAAKSGAKKTSAKKT